MGRRVLATGEGLWLPGDKSIHMMFMRFPVDAVFLAPPEAAGERDRSDAADGTWRVVAVRRQLPPWRGVVWWVGDAAGCLELPAGTVDSFGLAEGDLLRFESA